uniref:Uncharacterized protein n=1 Tax=Desulfacinum infernum TaxID=35837 RepID=A0A832A1M5_9BACT
MVDYEIRWITDQLAVGHAPMSYQHLSQIAQQGIGAIVNLCGEYCDLHEIEEKSGTVSNRALSPVRPFHLVQTHQLLFEMSRSLFFALNGFFLEGRSLIFPLPHVVSGKFIQDYFAHLKELGGLEPAFLHSS